MRLPALALLLAALGTLTGAARPAAAQVNIAALTARKASSFADVADVETAFEPAQARPGEVVKFKLTITPKPGCWTYPAVDFPPEQTGRNVIKLPQAEDVVFAPE